MSRARRIILLPVAACLAGSLLPGCVFVGPRSIVRVWADCNTYSAPAFCMERMNHLPYRQPRVETIRWSYGLQPEPPAPAAGPHCENRQTAAIGSEPHRITDEGRPVEIPTGVDQRTTPGSSAPPLAPLPADGPKSRPNSPPPDAPLPPLPSAAGAARQPAIRADGQGRVHWRLDGDATTEGSRFVSSRTTDRPVPPGTWLFRRR